MPVCTRVELALYEGEEIHEEDTLSDEEENGPWEYTYGVLDSRAALVTKFGGRTADEHPLEHLSVRIVDSGSGDGFWNKIWANTHELASDLAQFTQLCTLMIRFNHFHPRATQEPTDTPASTICLPHLTHLHLSATTAWLYTAAATIITPDTTYRSFSLQLPSASHQEQPWGRLTGTEYSSPGWMNDLRTTLRLPVSTPGSYTDLYIVPARDRTRQTMVDEWDDSLDNAAYASMLECALKMLPLGDLHTLHVSHPRANALLGFEGALAGVAKARRLELAFYGAGGTTLLALPKLEEICLRSLTDLPTLPDIAPTRHTRIDVSHCAFSEEEVAAVHG
ncbi:hypothetical protein PENSPDRAFT_692683 [Peniophora sp. CONT]|nr:hypothetical protein PENSPDRAFT_692683 [Peniophora sp. CONT]